MSVEIRLVAVVSAVASLFALLTILVPAAGAAWSAQTTPTPPKGTETKLFDISCKPSTSACTSVGVNIGGEGGEGPEGIPIAQRWNGTSWSSQSPAKKLGVLPTNLFGVDCPSETRCMAVGYYEAGEGPVTVAELWNEGKWNVHTPPVPSESTSSGLNAVGCNSTANCTAVGSAVINEVMTAIAAKWNSPTWTSSPVPMPEGAEWSQLDGVDCLFSNFCAAVGNYVPNGGSEKSLVMFWNGEWKIHSLTNPVGAVESTLHDVSCTPTPNRCTAVGGWRNSKGEEFTLAYRFNGVTTWTLQSTPNPSGSVASVFQDVSCATETSCTAAGSWVSGSGGSDQTLAEEWNGSSWSEQSTANPAGAGFDGFFGVSCQEADCLGVGWSETANTTMAQIRE